MTTMIVPPSVPVAPGKGEVGIARASQPGTRDRSAGGQFAEVLLQQAEADHAASGDAATAAPARASVSGTPVPDSPVAGSAVVPTLAAMMLGAGAPTVPLATGNADDATAGTSDDGAAGAGVPSLPAAVPVATATAVPAGIAAAATPAAPSATPGDAVMVPSPGTQPEPVPGAPVAVRAAVTSSAAGSSAASASPSGDARHGSSALVDNEAAPGGPVATTGGPAADAGVSLPGDGVVPDGGPVAAVPATAHTLPVASASSSPTSGDAAPVPGVSGTGAPAAGPSGADGAAPAPTQAVQSLPTTVVVPPLPQAVPVPLLTPSASDAQPVHPPTPTHPSLQEQIAPRIASVRQLGDGVHRLTLRVEPEAIGAVRVVAEVRGDDVRLQLFGGTEAAREALRNALPDLRRDLATSGLQAQLDLGTSGERQPGQRTSRSDVGLSEGRSQRHDPGDGTSHLPGRGDQRAAALPGAGRLDVLA